MQTWLGLLLNQVAKFVLPATLIAAFFLATPAWSQSSNNPGAANESSGIASRQPLDGRKFSAKIVQADANNDDKNQPLGDMLTFSDGKFSSEICRRFNFTEAPYWVRVKGDQIHFLVELKSPTDGTMLWEGTVRGNTLEGTMQWKKERWYWTIDAKHKIRGDLIKGANTAPSTTN